MHNPLRSPCWILALAVLVPVVSGAANPAFTEVSAAAGVSATHATVGIFDHFDYVPGGAVGDFNNDGWQDIFMISGGVGGLPDRLFINNHDGTFTDRASEYGLVKFHLGKGATAGDFNNDGWLDLFVTSAGDFQRMGPGHHLLYRNNGDETFTNVALSAGVAFSTSPQQEEDGFGAAFGDFDLDGDLDLFVAGFAPNNSGNRLYRNNGDETFTDVTGSSGPSGVDLFAGTPLSLKSFAPRFVDMDGDRYPELLLASDFGTSRYFRNNTDGSFTDVTDTSGTGVDENGMGQTVGDFDGDGLLDWYVTSIYYPPFQWTGNKLYRNQGNHTYVEDSVNSGVDDGGYGWATVAVDFNHDRLLDIAETNGAGSVGSFGGEFDNEPSYLWIQNNNGTFTEMALASGFSHLGRGRGMSNLDYDNDGDQDLVIFNFNEPLALFRNDLAGSGTNWIRIFLDTTGQPGLAPHGCGAKVTVTTGQTSQIRAISAGDNFLSNSELSAHFGLANAQTIDEVRVDWPDGSSTVLQGLTPNRTLTIRAGPREAICTDAGDNDNDGLVDCDDPDCCGQTGCQSGQGVCCQNAAACDDGLFCNGVEQCIDDLCVAGVESCAGQACDESGQACPDCMQDADCDDGQHCNGAETCASGVCSNSGDPCPQGEFCEEYRQICVECEMDADCPDDGVFCNGREFCNLGSCDSARDECVGRLCDEQADTCIGTVELQPRAGMPLLRLSQREQQRFEAGRVAFDEELIEASGLGPIYNANRCSACHDPDRGGQGSTLVTRFGMDDNQGGVLPLPGGPVLQTLATSAGCAETLTAAADVTTNEHSLGMMGSGLIQQIPDAAIHSRVINPPAGISGRVQVAGLLELPGETAVGRLGWKSSSATVISEVARQARDHLGLTNRLVPDESAPNGDLVLLDQCDAVPDPEDLPDGDGFDFIDRVSSYVRLLAGPPATPKGGMSGYTVFDSIGCTACHNPLSYTTGDPRLEAALAGRFFFAYSDFLVHDMGANGDPLPVGAAAPGEVRTSPLWGLRLRDPLWHDGRFAGGTFESRVGAAIAAHDAVGSEAQASAQAYAALSSTDRDSVLAFLDSLGRAEFDHDGDGDVDAADLVQFDACFSGPGSFYTADDPCAISDVDQDGDVDDDDRVMFEVAADGPAGRVPSGSLTVESIGAGQLRLDWAPSCSNADADYAIYEGTLGDFASHAAVTCTTAGATVDTIVPDAGSTYYLVVPRTGFREGSYGVDGAGSERRQGTAACKHQALGACD